MKELEKQLSAFYDKFKLMLYDKALKDPSADPDSDLSLQEVICMEIIVALGSPTVTEFSRYSKLSGSNAAYRLKQLESKGYIIRKQNAQDKREFIIEATDLYRERYGVIFDYIHLVSIRVDERFSKDEVASFTKMLGTINEELMPEAGTLLRDKL